ncbi:hypothetical protein BHE74_00055724 [Ensete ventricosum]|nr:hypothetical protein BHE74_00055724 [Ensete ventricosum]
MSIFLDRWVRFGKDLELLDSPGILPMRISDQTAAIKLAICDDIGERSYDAADVAAILVQIFLQKLALQLFSGDVSQAAFRILSDFRKGKFGWVALERPPRSPCCEKAHTNRGAWTKEEDQLLIAYIKAHGEGCWRSLPKAAGLGGSNATGILITSCFHVRLTFNCVPDVGLLRCGKSCRLRWINYLRPDLKRGNFTEEEDELIIKLHGLLGNK